MEKKKKYCSGCESDQYIWKAHEGNNYRNQWTSVDPPFQTYAVSVGL